MDWDTQSSASTKVQKSSETSNKPYYSRLIRLQAPKYSSSKLVGAAGGAIAGGVGGDKFVRWAYGKQKPKTFARVLGIILGARLGALGGAKLGGYLDKA